MIPDSYYNRSSTNATTQSYCNNTVARAHTDDDKCYAFHWHGACIVSGYANAKFNGG